jgi:hypothetical protein
MMTRPIPTANITSTDMIEQQVDATTTTVPNTALVQPVTIYDAGKADP